MKSTDQKENEKKKAYLKSYQSAVRREKDILEEIQRLRMNKMFPAVINDGMPKGRHQSDLSDYAALLDEQIRILKKECLKKVKVYGGIEDKIRRMENEEEQRVLRLRYIRGMKWEEVVLEMGYSWQHTHRIHARALINFKMR